MSQEAKSGREKLRSLRGCSPFRGQMNIRTQRSG